MKRYEKQFECVYKVIKSGILGLVIEFFVIFQRFIVIVKLRYYLEEKIGSNFILLILLQDDVCVEIEEGVKCCKLIVVYVGLEKGDSVEE